MTGPADHPDDPLLLDARGQRCPLPVIRLGALLRDVPEGTVVRLLATDPAARSDVAAFCRMRGHDLVDVTDTGEHTAYRVRKVSRTPPGAAPSTPARAAEGTPAERPR